MEKVFFKNSRDLKLVGNLYEAASEKIILLCHGFMSSKFSKGRFEILANALNSNGFSALSFDFSGCGESDDDIINVDMEVEDIKAAIDFTKARGYKEIALYGHSLGTLICLKAYSDEIKTMVLSGALTDSMYYEWDKFFSEEQLQALENLGVMTEYSKDDLRNHHLLDKKTLLAFESINQQELLEKVKCPVLIIHGDNEEEEYLLYQRSLRGMKFLSKESKL